MPLKINGETYYRTNEAARLIGVSKQTLHRWFRESKMMDVGRDHRGWRVFSNEDIKRIRGLTESVSR